MYKNKSISLLCLLYRECMCKLFNNTNLTFNYSKEGDFKEHKEIYIYAANGFEKSDNRTVVDNFCR